MTTKTPSGSETIQRVRVGMIGLAAVVLIIGLASAIFSSAHRERSIAAADAPRADAVANMSLVNATQPVGAPNEPLAELGVAPSTTNGTMAAAPRR